MVITRIVSMNSLFRHQADMNEISRVQIDGLALSQTIIRKNAFQMSFWHESGLLQSLTAKQDKWQK